LIDAKWWVEYEKIGDGSAPALHRADAPISRDRPQEERGQFSFDVTTSSIT